MSCLISNRKIRFKYQPRASAPIDAGEVVADNGKIGDYRYYFKSFIWLFAGGWIQSKVDLLC
jgi:hypothetical protein